MIYNELARALGYQQETIEKEDEMLLIPGNGITKNKNLKMVINKKDIEVIQAIGQRHFM